MIKVKITGTVLEVGPITDKETYVYRKVLIKKSGYVDDIKRRISGDQVYEINAVNEYIDQLRGICPGDKVEALSFLNSRERSDGKTIWHNLNLNLRRITKQ